MAENFTSVEKYINLHIQEAEQTPNRMKPKDTHIKIHYRQFSEK